MIISAPLLRAVSELGRWVGRRRRRFRVVGASMEPTLAGGEFVLVDLGVAPQVGELALAAHPEQPDLLVVKRVREVKGDGSYLLVSDNPAGADSRRWGPLPADRVQGRVTLVLDRPLAPLTGSRDGESEAPPSLARWLRR